MLLSRRVKVLHLLNPQHTDEADRKTKIFSGRDLTLKSETQTPQNPDSDRLQFNSIKFIYGTPA